MEEKEEEREPDPLEDSVKGSQVVALVGMQREEERERKIAKSQSRRARFSRAQLRMLDEAQKPEGRRIEDICAAAGVPSRTFYKWLKRDNEYRAAWQSAWQGLIRRQLPGLAGAMVAKALMGDVNAARLVCEMARLFRDDAGPDGGAKPVVIEIVNYAPGGIGQQAGRVTIRPDGVVEAEVEGEAKGSQDYGA